MRKDKKVGGKDKKKEEVRKKRKSKGKNEKAGIG